MNDPDESLVGEIGATIFRVVEQIAARRLSRETPSPTLSLGDVAQEAMLRLLRENHLPGLPKSVAVRHVARVIRNWFFDRARARGRQKRTGGHVDIQLVPEAGALPGGATVDMVAQREALERLAALNPRHADVFELRYFGGCSQLEVAELLDINPKTVASDEACAKAWLRHALQ
ncbi:MAG: sigma-70 family RNA polymerase sigma factor [Planctomycetes bacterium]|nr:sigma-70 family RNA polymerase sigma factor [Planctomycetota bacterium]